MTQSCNYLAPNIVVTKVVGLARSLNYGLSLSVAIGMASMIPAQAAVTDVQINGLVSRAIETHPLVGSARAEQQATTEGITAAKLNLLPTPSISAGYDNDSDFVTQMAIRQPLWTAGRLTANVNQAIFDDKAAQEFVYEQQNEVARTTIEAWQSYITAVAQQRVSLDSLRTLNDFEQMMQRRVAQGVSARIELNLVTNRILQEQNAYEAAAEQQRIAAARLEQIIGERITQGTALTVPDLGVLVRQVKQQSVPFEQMAFNEASFYNPTVVREAYQVESAKQELEAQQSALYPSIYAQYEQTYYQDKEDNDGRFSVGVDYTPGAGFSSLALSRASNARINSLIETQEAARRSVMEDIQVRYQQFVSAQSRELALEAAVAGAQIVVDSYRRQFIAGRKEWLDVLNAVRELNDYQTQLARTRAQILGSFYTLQVDFGLMPWQQFANNRQPTELFNAYGSVQEWLEQRQRRVELRQAQQVATVATPTVATPLLQPSQITFNNGAELANYTEDLMQYDTRPVAMPSSTDTDEADEPYDLPVLPSTHTTHNNGNTDITDNADSNTDDVDVVQSMQDYTDLQRASIQDTQGAVSPLSQVVDIEPRNDEEDEEIVIPLGATSITNYLPSNNPAFKPVTEHFDSVVETEIVNDIEADTAIDNDNISNNDIASSVTVPHGAINTANEANPQLEVVNIPTELAVLPDAVEPLPPVNPTVDMVTVGIVNKDVLTDDILDASILDEIILEKLEGDTPVLVTPIMLDEENADTFDVMQTSSLQSVTEEMVEISASTSSVFADVPIVNQNHLDNSSRIVATAQSNAINTANDIAISNNDVDSKDMNSLNIEDELTVPVIPIIQAVPITQVIQLTEDTINANNVIDLDEAVVVSDVVISDNDADINVINISDNVPDNIIDTNVESKNEDNLDDEGIEVDLNSIDENLVSISDGVITYNNDNSDAQTTADDILSIKPYQSFIGYENSQ